MGRKALPLMNAAHFITIVVQVALAASRHLFPVTPKVLPELNANHPHQSINKPTSAFVGLPMGGAPSMSHLPNLGPSIIAATKAMIKSCGNLWAILCFFVYLKHRPPNGQVRCQQCQQLPYYKEIQLVPTSNGQAGHRPPY